MTITLLPYHIFLNPQTSRLGFGKNFLIFSSLLSFFFYTLLAENIRLEEGIEDQMRYVKIVTYVYQLRYILYQ